MSESTATLFGRLRQPQIDPTTGQPVPRSRPVLDAIKAALTELVKSGAVSLGPLLLQLAQKYLGQLATAQGSESASKASDATALVAALHAENPVTAAAAIPNMEDFLELVVSLLNKVGPVAIDWLIDLLSSVYGSSEAGS